MIVERVIEGVRFSIEIEQWAPYADHVESGASTLLMGQAFASVAAERFRQVELHADGTLPGPACESGRNPLLAVAVLVEEVGEFVGALLSGDHLQATGEAVQMAAVANAIVEGLLNTETPDLIDWRGRKPEGEIESALALTAAATITTGNIARAAIETYEGKRVPDPPVPYAPIIHIPGRDF